MYWGDHFNTPRGAAPFDSVAPTPPDMAGRSLLPLLRGTTAEHRDEVCCEYHAALRGLHRNLSGWSDTRATMIRNHRYKLAIYHGHPVGELFDLQEDPREHRNLWNEASHAELRFDLLRRCFDATAFAIDTGPEVTCKFGAGPTPPAVVGGGGGADSAPGCGWSAARCRSHGSSCFRLRRHAATSAGRFDAGDRIANADGAPP